MTDKESIEQSVVAFHSLSGDDMATLKDLNTKIQNHEGKWGVSKGGEKTTGGAIQMHWVQNDPLIYEFIDFMADKNLLPVFDWTKWDEGSELFTSEDLTKYDNIDVDAALKLVLAATRKERFADGTMAWAFESGGFPKLVNRLVALGASNNE
jgi:hypothetical protein